MLFFGVLLCETARIAAKSRTNHSTHSGKATKRLGRLTPHLAHMCRFIWEWISAKQIAPRNTRGHWGVSGQTFKSLGKLTNGWTDWHQLWFTSADSSGNGYPPNKLPTDSQGGICGVLGSQQFKSLHSLIFMSSLIRLIQHAINCHSSASSAKSWISLVSQSLTESSCRVVERRSL